MYSLLFKLGRLGVSRDRRYKSMCMFLVFKVLYGRGWFVFVVVVF